MRIPRLTTWRLMLMIAIMALLIAGAIESTWAFRLREELRARQGTAQNIDSWLQDTRSRLAATESRIARAETQQSPDPRLQRWRKEVIVYRTRIAQFELDLNTYQRLAVRPWETWPSKGYERNYLSDEDFAYVYRLHRDRTLVFWRVFFGLAGVLAALALAPLLASAMKSLKKARPS
jgi:hypothetical protein